MSYTKGPWGWVVHDHSMASLGVLPDPGLGDPLVMTAAPCNSCASKQGEWEWGRCGAPSWEDAQLIAAAPEMAAALRKALPWLTICDDPRSDETLRLVEAVIAKLPPFPPL